MVLARHILEHIKPWLKPGAVVVIDEFLIDGQVGDEAAAWFEAGIPARFLAQTDRSFLYGAGDPIETARVWKGDRETVGLGLEQDLYVTVPRGRYPDLQAFMDVTPQLIAPLESARPVGRVTVSLDEEIIDSRDLFPLATVPQGSLWQQASDSVLLWFE